MQPGPGSPRSIDGIRVRNETQKPHPKKRKGLLTHKLLSVVCVLSVCALLVLGAFLWLHKPQETSYDDTNVTAIKERIAAHYLLPTDEEPALATVTDKSKLSTPFLTKAENGDKLLIYQRNRLAIIYRPSIDRVVGVGPVSIDEPPAALKNQ